jgi:hypothetical protein
VGALIALRNVTDEARVQARYQEMVEEAQRARQELETKLALRTQELLAADRELNRLEKALAELRRELDG